MKRKEKQDKHRKAGKAIKDTRSNEKQKSDKKQIHKKSKTQHKMSPNE